MPPAFVTITLSDTVIILLVKVNPTVVFAASAAAFIVMLPVAVFRVTPVVLLVA